MAMKHARNVDKCQVSNIIRRRGVHVYHSVRKNSRAFSTWPTRTGSSNISPSMALIRTV